MSLRQRITVLLIVTTIAIVGLMILDRNDRPAPTYQPLCTEDMPCWDCHTMGNMVCGTTTPVE